MLTYILLIKFNFWKFKARNPEDLINKLRTLPVNKSRLRFEHSIEEPQILEEIVDEEETTEVPKTEEVGQFNLEIFLVYE